MRKHIILAVAAMALAMAVAGTASASVNVNDQGVGFVGKGDVQTALGGINNAALQSKWDAGEIKFTGHTWLATETRWTCGSGDNSRTSKVVQDTKLDVTPNLNPQGKVADGFHLNGHGSNVGGAFVSGGYSGAPYVGYCDLGAFGGFMPHVFTSGIEPGIYVNGVALPNTPVEVAPVA
jgi:hypothetical protein